jgi:hypothetical protein
MNLIAIHQFGVHSESGAAQAETLNRAWPTQSNFSQDFTSMDTAAD